MRLRLLTVCLCLLARPVLGASIVSTIPETMPLGYNGFYVGAMDVPDDDKLAGPDGFDRFTAAQTFNVLQDITDATFRVGLAGTGLAPDGRGFVDALGNPIAVTFELVQAVNNAPSDQILATTRVTLTTPQLGVYDLAFDPITLRAGTSYWLIATSTNIGAMDAAILPIWAAATQGGPVRAFSQNDGPWTFQPTMPSMMFAITGTTVGTDPALLTTTVPEPATLLLLTPMALLWRRHGRG